ncbi:hypothetical protein DAPPUDRAFT_239450 [Daphnia pulex]|uniref:Uncharacterized protein n=1 Tax=Daphnia pulex TaxID=6669 RepID=E9G9D5_DAPPU|nr:hypothetical protein DAPPUDRAFT_239450 [Daphnia pulex]|eukprot:EFX83897.1 hypothetical protein DAPPUDRAFT_239450 [Daphnia pulex]
MKPMIVLGLDPGLRTTGWGSVFLKDKEVIYQPSGLIKTPEKCPTPERLAYLFQALTTIIREYCPEEVSVEEVFVNKNPKSSLKLALARGVVLCAPAVIGLPVFSYAPNYMKKALSGYGHADKNQIGWAVQQILKLKTPPQKDAADALGLAICHSYAKSTPQCSFD